jgi:hypothetical protein
MAEEAKVAVGEETVAVGEEGANDTLVASMQAVVVDTEAALVDASSSTHPSHITALLSLCVLDNLFDIDPQPSKQEWAAFVAYARTPLSQHSTASHTYAHTHQTMSHSTTQHLDSITQHPDNTT